MSITEIAARALVRRQRRVDSWFLSGCGMNLYRGCAHNCAYCDGRTERYNAPGQFGEEVEVKTNAPDLLGRVSSFGRAARSLARTGNPNRGLRDSAGVGPVTERIVGEILARGCCAYYDQVAQL